MQSGKNRITILGRRRGIWFGDIAFIDYCVPQIDTVEIDYRLPQIHFSALTECKDVVG
jgi:hypothetical protein